MMVSTPPTQFCSVSGGGFFTPNLVRETSQKFCVEKPSGWMVEVWAGVQRFFFLWRRSTRAERECTPLLWLAEVADEWLKVGKGKRAYLVDKKNRESRTCYDSHSTKTEGIILGALFKPGM